MEKISKIVPSSPRTRAIDVSRSQPVRPGAPAWGRPEGKVTTASAIEDKISLSSIEAERPLALYGRELKEARHAKIAKDMAEKFFANQVVEEVRETDMPLSEEMAENISVPTRSSVNPYSSNEEME